MKEKPASSSKKLNCLMAEASVSEDVEGPAPQVLEECRTVLLEKEAQRW